MHENKQYNIGILTMDIFDSIYIKVCFTVQTSNFDWIVLKKKDLRSSYTVTHFGI